MNNDTKKSVQNQDFNFITIRLASPDRMREWSFGEVTKPETINYRTQRSEKSGLFDEKIFGPDKDYECYCGKYRGVRYKGIVCEKCGVEITRSIVRRERMGHIELCVPVSHIWFLRGTPSRIGMLLGMSGGDLEKVIYFAGYIVTKVDNTERDRILRDIDSEFKAKVKTLQDEKTVEALKEKVIAIKNEVEEITPGVVLDEVAFHNFSVKYGTLFEAEIGAEAVYKLCKNIDLPKLQADLEKMLEKASPIKAEKLNKRLSLVKSMIAMGVRPEWMFLTVIPVIPPALRPMVPLDGGRYATSDVNDLYRRVINRNNRLRKLRDISAPDVILRNEKRILQEAVDALIDNSIRHSTNSAGAVSAAQRRTLKSLADNLKGKRGLFRQNLLGKRVDYSGRSVIVVGPELKLHQCGLPKMMALELFKPFVMAKLLERELAFNIRGATRLIEEGVPEVWAILEEVITGKYVLLNRAPTLHRLGIQAFQPILIEGSAIQVHPLVCTAFNADFDGEQMAVHVPLGEEAQAEAREIMAADKNILKPGSGDPVVSAKMLDIVLGCYWMTKTIAGEKGEGKYFANPNSAITAYDFGAVSFRAKIHVLPTDTPKYAEYGEKIFETTVGRLLFNSVLPSDYAFVNSEINRKKMQAIIDDLIEKYGMYAIAPILDRVKAFGFKYATQSGTTWGIDDIKEPEGKGAIISAAKEKGDEVMHYFNEGLLSQEEKIRKTIEIWQGAKNEVEKLIPATLPVNGSVSDMLHSGARGSIAQITQMAGMKGLIVNTAGETIEFPVVSSSKMGLTPIEYFITTHGSRKGLTDTALNTAKAGYLTRRLFDVAQDAMVIEEDCGTKMGIIIKREMGTAQESVAARNIKGRVLSEDVLGSNGEVILKRGHFVTKGDLKMMDEHKVTTIMARSPLTCDSLRGVCQKCYGIDLGRNDIVQIGEAVGTIAAQAIGEPGTQLTMRTFHAGGISVVGGDITQGLPRVEEIFEKRKPKTPAVVCSVNGMITEIRDLGKEKVIVVMPELEDVAKGKKAASGTLEYSVSYRRVVLVKAGDKVKKGDILTDGSADIDEVFEYGGKEKAQAYIISEVNKIYELQGESVSKKHIEVIVRQMFSRKKILDAGSTNLSVGDLVENFVLTRENMKAKEADTDLAHARSMVMGISEISLSRRSFMSAASFQHTTRILINSAIRGNSDSLLGLKENIIIGRLIPAGSGFPGSQKEAMIAQVVADARIKNPKSFLVADAKAAGVPQRQSNH